MIPDTLPLRYYLKERGSRKTPMIPDTLPLLPLLLPLFKTINRVIETVSTYEDRETGPHRVYKSRGSEVADPKNRPKLVLL